VITGLPHCCRGDLEAPLGERKLPQVEEGQPRTEQRRLGQGAR
jgi:hypothetical protein